MIIYSVIEGIAILIASYAVFYILTRESTKEQKLILMSLMLCIVHNIAVLVEVNSKTVEGIENVLVFKAVATSFLALSYAYFVGVHCNRPLKRAVAMLFTLLGFVNFVFVLTDRFSNIYYRNIGLVKGEKTYFVFEYGPAVVILLFLTLAPFIYAMSILAKQIICEKESQQRKMHIILFGLSFIPVIAMAIDMTNTDAEFGFAPLVTLCIICLITFAFTKSNTFDILRMAQVKAIDVMDDAAIAIDQNMDFLYANDRAKELFPRLSENNVSGNVSLLTGVDEKIFTEIGRNRFDMEDRSYEAHVSAVIDTHDILRGYSVTILDVTQMQNYIEKIIKSKDEAIEAKNKVSEELNDMSRKLVEPMSAIVGLSDLIIEQSKGRKVYDYAKDIKDASSSLVEIINNILDKSKTDAGRNDIFESSYEVLAEMSDIDHMIGYIAERKGLRFNFRINRNIPRLLFGDREKIKQIAINLLNNAVEYTDVGEVNFEVDYEQIGERDLNLIMKVTDTGRGMSTDEQKALVENIGKVDVRSLKVKDGKGLGIAICHDLTELMDGFIDMNSTVGKGSVFTVIIPQKIMDIAPIKDSKGTDNNEVKEVPERNNEALNLDGAGILVVDDNKINLKVAIGLLEIYGPEIDFATSGKEAIEKVKQRCYDMIFMDHMMPEMDGIETTKIIRNDLGENGTKPVIVALTANAIEGAKEMFLDNGFDAFISKPINTDELHELLGRYFNVAEVKGKEEPLSSEEEIKVTPEDNISMEHVDIEAALKLHKKGIEDVLQLLQIFYEDGVEKVEIIRQYADIGDLKNYEIEVHGLKSAAANIGADPLSAKAKAHEMAAKEGNESFVLNNYEDLAKDYREVLEEIKGVLLSRNMLSGGSVDESDKKELPDGVLIKDKIIDILEQVEDFNSKEAKAKLEDLLEYKVGPDIRQSLNEIHTKLKMYDDDAAEELLSALVSRL